MKFNRLQASISNNADQSPSLFMAFCTIESLFADLEDNCGAEISRCPVGDERLPTKLVWMCRIINEIYRDNDVDLQRNRARLAAAMDKLQDTQSKLKESALVAERLAALKAEYGMLERQLQSSMASAEECEALSVKCRLAKQKLEQLSAFDARAAKTELEKLTAEIASQESVKASLSARLQQARLSVDALRQEVAGLQDEEQDMNRQFAALREMQQQTKEKNVQLHDSVVAMKADLTAAQEEERQLMIQQDETRCEIGRVRQRIAEFRDEKLVSQRITLEVLQKEMAQLEDEQAALDQACSGIKEQRHQLILEIAHKRAEIESWNEKMVLAQQKRDGLESEKNSLSADLASCLQDLEMLQSEVDQLTEKQLPEAQQLQMQEQQRKDELQQCVEQLQTQQTTLQDEITRLTQLQEKLEEEVSNNRVVYDALTASCAVNSNELENLERQIAELRNNTDEQKLVIYRKQLEETQKELENVQLECERIQEESIEQKMKLEQLQEERARLRDLKNRHEQGVIVTEKQLRELEFVNNEEYLHEVMALDEREKLLETVRGKLEASIANMHKILGYAPVETPIALETQLKHELRELRGRTDDLRSALVECAKSLKMEER